MPKKTEHGLNLLTDRLLTIDSGERVSLAGLFAGLAQGTIDRLPRLRAHQRTAWHMFTVQLAALALSAAGRSDLPVTADEWADLLRGLSASENEGYSDNPWRLVVEDRGAPAFLQPPDPGGLKWTPVVTPDALDLLITSRNHDLKSAIALPADPEDWVYALVSLQTMEGYGGGGGAYQGIARMNGGYSSRSFLGLIPACEDGTPDRSGWWRRDIDLCLAHRDTDSPMKCGGIALLWCLPWKQHNQLSVNDVDPLAIEVCRRVRLLNREDRLTAERARGTKRIDADAFHGVLGDPWAPISFNEDTPKALTIKEDGFNYRLLVKLLFSGDWILPLAARVDYHESGRRMLILAEALVRGQSTTDGLRSRLVPLPEKVIAAGWFGQSESSLADAASQQIHEIASTARALRDAVALYAADGNPDVFSSKDKRAQAGAAYDAAKPACTRLDSAADAVFFDHLWDRADPATQVASRQAFRAVLVETARAELERAFDAIPSASAFAARARVRAHQRLAGKLRKAELVEPEPINA